MPALTGLPVPPARRRLLLELDLTHGLAEPDGDDPIARLRSRARHDLRRILRALHEAGPDPRVVGLIARVGGGLPWTTMQELRLGVRAFAEAGKPTAAFAETFGEGTSSMADYVLATAFDRIWLQPGGSLAALGVGVETTFLRGALDRLGIEPQLEARHEYKSAADRIMRTGFTPAHREALDRVADSVFSTAVDMIAEGRGIDPQRVREMVDSGPFTGPLARDLGLVDDLGYRDQAHAAIRASAGEGAELLFADRWSPPARPHVPARRRGHVALVEVRGTLVSGRTRRGPLGHQVGSDTVGGALRAARADERARAVLLHVDSPGGSAVASESIWREVCRVRESGRPVVVSMGRLAASGGYYVSCPADVIVALPATLTGSIGVVGGKVVAADLLERLGVTTGSIARGSRALMHSPRRRYSDDELARLGELLDAIYSDFVGKVAQGRGRSQAQVDAVARGRVWTGSDALDRGLVDALGGLHAAARIARHRAGLPCDAPVLPALHLPPIARLGRPRSTEDPRAVMGSWFVGSGLVGSGLVGSGLVGSGLVGMGLLGLSDLSVPWGLIEASALRMPSLAVR